MNSTETQHNLIILAQLVNQREERVFDFSTRHQGPTHALKRGNQIYLIHEGEVKAHVPNYGLWMSTAVDGTSDYIRAPESFEDKFHRLADKWREESRFMSSTEDMAQLESYQSIIRMGRNAVPFILKELVREPDHWFIALEQITGANPVIAEDRGFVARMADAWLGWSRERHHI